VVPAVVWASRGASVVRRAVAVGRLRAGAAPIESLVTGLCIALFLALIVLNSRRLVYKRLIIINKRANFYPLLAGLIYLFPAINGKKDLDPDVISSL
jgi:flagellar biosynthesis protein FliQ